MGAREHAIVNGPERGQVYRLRTAGGTTPCVVVSNDLRNGSLPTVLVARISTAPRPAVPTIVELPVGEPVVGRVLCDSVTEVAASELGKALGTLSRDAMRRIGQALSVALGL